MSEQAFKEWWNDRNSTTYNIRAHRDNVKAAWDHQQKRIDDLYDRVRELETALDGFRWRRFPDEPPKYTRDTPCIIKRSDGAIFTVDWEPDIQEFEFEHKRVIEWMPVPDANQLRAQSK